MIKMLELGGQNFKALLNMCSGMLKKKQIGKIENIRENKIVI